jgi:hypothetical protein
MISPMNRQIWESFKLIWGECDDWKIIKGEIDWIDNNYKIRTAIAHGTQPVDIETVKDMVAKIGKLKSVAHKFLIDWRELILKSHHD